MDYANLVADLQPKVLIPDNIVELLRTRMGKETETSLLYKDISTYFEKVNLNGFSKYFNHESKGEEHHARKIKQFLADMQADNTQPQISYSPTTFKNVLDIMQAYVAAELQTTTDLKAICKAALDVGDYMTFSWLTSPETDDKGKVIDYGLIPYQVIELSDAYDLWLRVGRVVGPDGQDQGDGLNNIDARL